MSLVYISCCAPPFIIWRQNVYYHIIASNAQLAFLNPGACHLCNSSGITLLQSELICFENPPLLRIVQWNALLQSLQYDDTRQSLAELLTQNLPCGGADKSSAGMFGVWCQWCPAHIVPVPSIYRDGGAQYIWWQYNHRQFQCRVSAGREMDANLILCSSVYVASLASSSALTSLSLYNWNLVQGGNFPEDDTASIISSYCRSIIVININIICVCVNNNNITHISTSPNNDNDHHSESPSVSSLYYPAGRRADASTSVPTTPTPRWKKNKQTEKPSNEKIKDRTDEQNTFDQVFLI